MDDTNPYTAPEPVSESTLMASPAGGASLIWMASAVAATVGASCFWFSVRFLGYTDIATTFFRAMLPTAALAIPAVAIYAATRRLLGRKLDQASTPASLVVAGLLIGSLMSIIYLWLSLANELMGWGVSVFAGAVAMIVAFPIERKIAIRFPQRSGSLAPVVGASVFWFTAGCLVFGFIAGAMMQAPGLPEALAGGVITAALLCLLGTATYGIVDASFTGSQPASVTSRIAASAMFVCAVSLAGFLMDQFDIPPGMWRMLMLVPAALVSLVTDRVLRGHRQAI